MVGVDDSRLQAGSPPKSVGLVQGWRSDEPRKVLLWFFYDNYTINIVAMFLGYL